MIARSLRNRGLDNEEVVRRLLRLLDTVMPDEILSQLRYV